MKKGGQCLLIIVVLFFLPVPVHAYLQLIGLGDLSRDNYSSLSINNSGQIVGDIDIGGNVYHACLYDYYNGGTFTDLGTLGGTFSQAACINDSGDIVGGANNNDNQSHGCYFDSSGSGQNIDLGLGSASCINNSGLVVGVFDGVHLKDINNPDFHLYLGGLSPGSGGNPTSINDNGCIVGFAGARACLFDETGAGNNINLGTLGGDLSRAESVNNAGLIVGWARIESNESRACLFDPTGQGNNIDLGAFSSNSGSFGKAINNQNQIVGYSHGSASGKVHACLFDINGNGPIDLNNMIDPSLGWELLYGHDINDNGWIVGWGIPPEGGTEAFLLTPEPCTLTLLALGGLFLRKRRR